MIQNKYIIYHFFALEITAVLALDYEKDESNKSRTQKLSLD